LKSALDRASALLLFILLMNVRAAQESGAETAKGLCRHAVLSLNQAAWWAI
jgi:hypothetical protein